MSETTLYEVAFYSEGDLKTSLQAFDSMSSARAAFLDVVKTYLKGKNDETRIVVCTEENPDIKKNHKVYPVDSFVLMKINDHEDRYSVMEKKTIVNEGYIYNSESHRVNNIGTVAIMEVKLSPCLVNRMRDLKERESSLEIMITDTNQKRLHAIKLMRELNADKEDCDDREERIQMRETRQKVREQMLNEWENDLEKWETTLEHKSQEVQTKILEYETEITILEAKIAAMEEIEREEVEIHYESLASESDLEDSSEITTETESESEEIVIQTNITPVPHVNYLNELQVFLKDSWGRIEEEHNEDTSYRDHIESVINPGKQPVIFGVVKEKIE